MFLTQTGEGSDWARIFYARFDNPEVLADSRLHQLHTVQAQQAAYASERYLPDHHELAVTGGAYSRHLKQARRHLADAIADREIALMTASA